MPSFTPRRSAPAGPQRQTRCGGGGVRLGLCVRTGNPKPAEVGHQMKTALLSGVVESLSLVPPQGERQGPWEAGRGACLCS